MESQCLSYEKFMMCKKHSINIPTELESYINSIKLLHLKNKKNPVVWRKNEKAKTSWLVTKKLNQNSEDQLVSNFKGILNKISNGNFNDMMTELFNLEIHDALHLQTLIDLIFKKAVIEEKFSGMYSKMVSFLYPKYVTDDNGDKVFFRVLFLEKCQYMFKNCIEINTEADLADTPLKTKMEIHGLMVFIGELYNNNLVTNTIIYSCLVDLVIKVSEGKMYAIENVCKMLSTIRIKFAPSCPNDYHKIVSELKKLKSTFSSKKDQFMLMDVLEAVSR